MRDDGRPGIEGDAPHPERAIHDDVAARRFEVEVGGHLAIVAYELEGDTIVFTHTEVPPELSGCGIGGRLVRGALDAARERGLAVVPRCSFMARYMRDHPDTHDLLAPTR